MRRISAVILAASFILLAGCAGAPPVTSAPPSGAAIISPSMMATPRPSPLQTAFTVEEIGSFFGMEKDALSARLGGGFGQTLEEMGDGSAHPFAGEYESGALGLKIGYTGFRQLLPLYLKFAPGKGLSGLDAGADFAGIQSVLGQAVVEKTWRGSPADKLFALQYDHQDFTMELLSASEDGSGWWLECWKGYTKQGPREPPKPFHSKYPKLKAETMLLDNGTTLGDISELKRLNKYDMLKKLGFDCEVAGTYADGHFDGYSYDHLSLKFVYDPDIYDEQREIVPYDQVTFDQHANNSIISISVDEEKVCILGVQVDMDYKRIQERLGKGEYQKTFGADEGDEWPVYCLEYSLGSYILRFESGDKNGKDWCLYIETEM